MIDYTFDEYLKFLDEKANKWYKKLFVNFVKKHFPKFLTKQYRKWQLNVFIEKLAIDYSSFTSMTNEDIDKLVSLMKN